MAESTILTPSRPEVLTTGGEWQDRLRLVVDLMRDMSRHTDPQAMVRQYMARVRHLTLADRTVALSRRDLKSPWYRITRSSTWTDDINPWQQKDRLPLLEGGLLSELIYSDKPHLIDDLHLSSSDPAYPYLAGQRSLAALPLYDGGAALNMVVIGRREPAAFQQELFPEMVWTASLFGRATQSLVLTDEVKRAYEVVDREFRVIGEIQRTLLPDKLPKIPTLDLAAHYETSARAGGDYYDFFPLPDGRWGIFIADVSGHGAPAAVLMAITHAIAHLSNGTAADPASFLSFLNRQLVSHYVGDSGTFVTAFYGVYNPASREMCYSNAGHPPPRVKSCSGGAIIALDQAASLPLGIDADSEYTRAVCCGHPHDQVIFYTDGVTEARNPAGLMFETARLDAALSRCRQDAGELIRAVLDALNEFTAGHPVEDDRTLLVAKILDA